MVKIVFLKFILFLLTIFSIIHKIQFYVLCEDGDSACPDSFICCKKDTGGFSCCSNTRFCCYGGSRCCAEEKSIKFLLEKDSKNNTISTNAFFFNNPAIELLNKEMEYLKLNNKYYYNEKYHLNNLNNQFLQNKSISSLLNKENDILEELI